MEPVACSSDTVSFKKCLTQRRCQEGRARRVQSLVLKSRCLQLTVCTCLMGSQSLNSQLKAKWCEVQSPLKVPES